MSRAREQANLSSDSNIFVDIANDRTGIGITTPSQKLEIDGNIKLGDNQEILIGTGSDLKLWHDGTHSYIRTTSGTQNLNLQTTNGQVILGEDGGHIGLYYQAGGTVELRYNNTKTFETVSGGAKVTGDLDVTGNIDVADNVRLKLGTHDDINIYHDGTNSTFENSGGNLYLKGKSGEHSIICNRDGAVELYYDNAKVLETAVNKLILTGNASECNIFAKTSDGTTRGIVGFTNSNTVTLYSGSSTKALEYASNALTLYHTGNAKFATNSAGVTVSGNCNVQGGGITMQDSYGYYAGTGNDLSILHDGTNSTILNTTGELIVRDDSRVRIRTDQLVINSGDNSESMIYAAKDGAVELYYNGSKKLETTNAGIGFNDNVKAGFGNGGDLNIYHTGSHSFVKHDGTGMLKICANMIDFRNAADNATLAYAQEGNKFELFYAGSSRFETTNTGAKVTGNLEVTGVLTYDDVTNIDSVGIVTARDHVKLVTNNKKITFGSGSNLEIYSTGTDGVVNAASGDIKIQKGGSGLLTFKSTGSHFLADVLIADSIIHDGDTNTKIRFPAADTITAETAGSERLRITSAGLVGIDENTPTGKLHISHTNGAGIFVDDSSNSGNSPYIQVLGKRSDGNTHQSFTGQIFLSSLRTDQKVASGKQLGTVLFGGNHTNGTEANILYAASIAGVADDNFDSATDMPTALVFKTGTTGRAPTTANVSSGDERLRINSGGQVLIGTTTDPAYTNRRLTVATTSGTTAIEVRSATNGDGRIYFTDNTTSGNVGAYAGKVLYDHTDNFMAFHTGGDDATPGERLRIASGGNVGINDTSPDTRLSVNSGTTDVVAKFTSSDANAWIQFRDNSTTDTGVMIGASGDNMMLRAGSNERVRITSTGRVRIGTGAIGLTNSMTAQGGLQVSTNGASGAPTVCFGADGTAANTQSITDNTIKDFRMGFPNYDIQEEPLTAMCGFVGDGSNADDNNAGRLYIGGGTSWMNAVNHIRFYTAPTNLTTVTGTERLRITSTGKIEVKGTRAGSLQANDDDALKLYTKSTTDDINRGVGITFYTHDGSGYEMGGTIQVAKENGTTNDAKSYMRFSTQSGSTTTERLRITSSGQVQILSNDLYFPSTGTIQWNTNVLNLRSTGAIGVVKVQADAAGNGWAPRFEVFHGDGSHRTHMLQGDKTGDSYLCKGTGQLGIGIEGPHGVSKVTIQPNNRTSAFSASDGDTWHDVILHQGGSATNNAVGIAFVLNNSGSYHENAGTGICAVKNGTNSDFGSDLVFITRPQNAVAAERLRIQADGDVSFGDQTTGRAQIKHVSGNQSDVNGGGFPQYAFVGNEGTGMRRVSSNVLAFDTNGAERLRIDAAGNMSLGRGAASSTNYGRNFQIHDTGTSGATLHLTTSQTGSSNSDGYHLVQQGAHLYHWLRESGDMFFATGAVERFRINSIGNVSIGGAEALPHHTGYNGATLHLYQSGSSNVGGELRFTTGASGHTVGDGGYIAYWTDHNFYCNNRESGGWLFYTSNAEKFRITSTQVASFGNSSPPAWQDSSGYYNIQLGKAGYFRADTDTSSNFLAFGVNAYRESGGWKHVLDGRATQINNQGGAISFYVSATGTANGGVSWNDTIMKIDHQKVIIGHSDDEFLQIPGDEKAIEFDEGQKMITINDGQGNFNICGGNNDFGQHVSSSSGTSGTARMTFNTDGQDGDWAIGVGPRRNAGETANHTRGIRVEYSASGMNQAKFCMGSATDPNGLATQYPILHRGNAMDGTWANNSGDGFKVLGDGGSIAITTNDGGGNSNVCFNCANNVADAAGSAWRIRADIDSTNSHYLVRNVKSVSNGGSAGSMTTRFEIDENGNGYINGSSISSDQRLKKNIKNITGATDKIKALTGRTFEWKEEIEFGEGTKYGFIAQELEPVIPELIGKALVHFDKDGNIIQDDYSNKGDIVDTAKTVNINGIVPVLVEALKEAITKIETLETKVAALESS